MNDLDIFSDVSNPLDSIEEVMHGHDWQFERPNSEELMVQITGRRGTYTMTFVWQEEYSAMQFFCEFDIEIPKERFDMTSKVLRSVNENLWLGHFDVPADSRVPYFRHTVLFRGMTYTSGTDHVADLIEVALAECEKNYNTFNMLSSSTFLNEGLLNLALTHTHGEA